MGEWRYDVKISDCLDIMYGKDQKLVEDNDKGVFPILGTGGIMGYAKRYLCGKPSVLIGRKGTIDEPQYMDTPFWTIDTLYYTAVYPENSAKYLFYVFQTIPWKKYNEATGVPSLAGSTIGKIKISLPVSKNEQSKIAEILFTVDETIDKTYALIEKYKNIKAGMMRDLLGKDIGEFSLLSELADTESGGTPSRSVPDYFNGNIPWVTTSELTDSFIVTTNESITLKGLRNSSAKLFTKDTVLMAMYGATIGKLGILGIDAATNQACCAFFCNDRINSKYLYYKLLFMRNELIALGSGAGQPNISQTVIKKLKIRVPSKPEQLQVVEQLVAADERIQTERDYLAKLQSIKFGLMQDLLTNTVSVDALL